MVKGFLLCEVDGSDVNPMGVFATPRDAAQHYVEVQESWVEGNPADDADFVEVTRLFWEEFERVVPAGAPMPEFPFTFDVQFESQYGSVDVRITEVEVAL